MPRLLTNDEIYEIVNSSDLLVLALRGHQAIDAGVCVLLEMSLPDPHRLEIERLSLMLKVDLCVAMGVLGPQLHRSFQAINTIRNRFAHDSTASLIADDRGLLVNSLDPDMRRSLEADGGLPPDLDKLFRTVMFLCFATVEIAVGRLRTQKATNEVLGEMIRERVGQPTSRPSRLDDELRRRVAEKLEGW